MIHLKQTYTDRYNATFTHCADTFHLRLTDYVHHINNRCQPDIGKNIIGGSWKLPLCEINLIRLSVIFTYCTDTFNLLLTDYIYYT